MLSSEEKERQSKIIFIILLFLSGFVFFVRNAHLQLASDDIGWLRGETPTGFDQYRYVPRFFFTALNALFGLSPVACLAMIFIFHFANSLLLGHFTKTLLKNSTASKVATVVFLINPITLSALTWFSCFSYVLGTSFALVSLLAAWEASARDNNKPFFWWIITLACYDAALFSLHAVLFLPLIFLLFIYFRRNDARLLGVVFSVLAMGSAVLVNYFVYDFSRYGVESFKLLTPGFISALTSSALSFGISLWLAYPLSFFVKTMGFLSICFSEPLRWGITVALLAGVVLIYKPSKICRIWWVIALSFVTLITPYIIRLYLMPDVANYHISYILTGRVFYLPFTIIALFWGAIVGKVYGNRVKANKFAWVLPFLAIAGYLHALMFVYDRTDFMGLKVVQGVSVSFPQPWNPYADNRPVWFISLTLIMIAVSAIRFVIQRKEKSGEKSKNYSRIE